MLQPKTAKLPVLIDLGVDTPTYQEVPEWHRSPKVGDVSLCSRPAATSFPYPSKSPGGGGILTQVAVLQSTGFNSVILG